MAEEREERSEGPGLLHLLRWEHLVILLLSALNLLLVSIIVWLVRRHRRLRRKLGGQRWDHLYLVVFILLRLLTENTNNSSPYSLVPSSLVGNIYSSCPEGKKEMIGGGPGGAEGVRGATAVGGDIQLYTSDSDISREQTSSERSEKEAVRGGTDTSYCSYSPAPTPSPTDPTLQYHHQYHHGYIPPQPNYSPAPSVTYSPLPSCCQTYGPLSSFTPPHSSFLSPPVVPSSHLPPPPSSLDCPSETASLLGRETPL